MKRLRRRRRRRYDSERVAEADGGESGQRQDTLLQWIETVLKVLVID